MQRFEVLKALSGGQKVFKIGPVALERRQGFIIMGAIFVFWLLYKQLAKVFELSAPQAAVLFGPLVILAIAVAFLQKDGRHLDWWFLKKWTNHMRPKTLLWRHAPADGRARPLRDSIQAALPAERFAWEMLRTKDGTYLLVFKVEPVALSLAGQDAQERVHSAYAALLNQLDFPIVEMTRTKEGNVTSYTRTLKEHVLTQVSAQDEPNLADFSRQHLSFLETIVPAYNIFEREGFLILPFKPQNPDKKSRFKRRPKEKDAGRLQREAEAAYAELDHRATLAFSAYQDLGARLRVLANHELQAFLKEQATGEETFGDPTMFEPVTLDHGGYTDLPPDRLDRVIRAAHTFQKKAPNALGIGDLTLADKISPDAVRIHPDRLEVNGRHHATVFVYEYPPDVGINQLRDLLHVPGRVKVVKYVNPMPQDQAVQILGNKVAELQAAEHTAHDGNVISAGQRAISKFSAQHGMEQLQTGQQGYLDVCFLIHCEADTEKELHDLVGSVQKRLAALRFDAKLAREEAWEGYVSCLPLAQNQLTKRYANKGLLTYAAACLFPYGSYQVNHRDGVLLGIDPISGGLVVLDSRELMNPHWVILGTSGGGKTQTVKAVSTRLRMRGHRVVIVDPVGDSKYGRVAKAIDGQYVVLSAGSPHKFNPCDLRGTLNLNILATASEDDEQDPEAAWNEARAAALDYRANSLTRLVSLMISSDDGAGGLSGTDYGRVEQLWYHVYADKGITNDPATHDNPAPTFRDFFAAMAEVPHLNHVREQLYPWEKGSLRTFFDSQTNVDLDNKFLVMQIAGVNGREKAAVMYALLDFLNGRLSDPDELSDLFIDEFWSMLKYPMAASFSEEMFRSGRARNNAMVAITQDVEEFVGSKSGEVIMRIAATHLILKQRKKTIEVMQDFYDFSEEQRAEVLNFRSGEGYLLVEENQVPLYVICSENEKKLFNTDAKKEAQYREAALNEERRRLESGQAPAGELSPSPDDYSDLPAPTLRKLSAAGMARQLISNEDSVAPRPEDYVDVEIVPVHDNDDLFYAPSYDASQNGSQNGSAAHSNRHRPGTTEIPAAPRPKGPPPRTTPRSPGARDVLGISVPPKEAATVVAVYGQSAGTVAYNLAGLVARAGKSDDRNVLLVDAEGRLSETVLSAIAHEPPDELASVGGLWDFVATDPDTNLGVLVHPENAALPGGGIIQLVREECDVVIAACALSMYGRDWLHNADVAIATDTSARELERTLRRAEEVRGRNGTIVAPMGRLKIDPKMSAHRVFRLPSRATPAIKHAEETGAFAALRDERVGQAFRPLLEELLNEARKETLST